MNTEGQPNRLINEKSSYLCPTAKKATTVFSAILKTPAASPWSQPIRVKQYRLEHRGLLAIA